MNNNLVKSIKKTMVVLVLLATGLASFPASGVRADSVQFSDIPANYWAKGGIDSAVKKGIVVGYPSGLFMPNANVSRAEFIKMIVTATGQNVEPTEGKWYEGYVNAAEQAKLYVTSDFANSELEWNAKITRKEMARIAARATGLETKEDDKWMYLAAKTGLISGLGAGKLGEKENTTRAQAVVTVERVLTVKGGGKLPIDKYAVGSAELVWHKTNIFTVMPEIMTTGDPVKDLNAADLWKEDKMKITSKDGLYSAELDELLVIDLADKNDPNLARIPDVATLKWKNTTDNTPDGIKIAGEYLNSYLLYSKGHVNFNNDTKRYSPIGDFTAEFSGLDNYYERVAFVNGHLNAQALVFQKIPFDLPMTILPKSGWKNTSGIYIRVAVPSYSAFYSLRNEILKIAGPNRTQY
ncbi:S-layer homology domain-containing protein [Paenibacillus sp. FSL M7-0896]|uniref:S-layer homology domain-containing protein n=1 Tax=Paenibacillus sp. FSL M7-0896 TaxID=2921610 RepID=UPI0030D82B38